MRWACLNLGLSLTSVSLAVAAPPSNDALTAAAEITALPLEATLDVAEATVEPSDPELGCGPPGNERGFRTVWYRFQFAEDTRVRCDVAGSEFPALIELFENTGTVASPELQPAGLCAQGVLEADVPAGLHVYMVVADSEASSEDTLLRLRVERSVSDIEVTASQLADWLAGLLYLNGTQVDMANVNGDAVTDIADVVTKVNSEGP